MDKSSEEVVTFVKSEIIRSLFVAVKGREPTSKECEGLSVFRTRDFTPGESVCSLILQIRLPEPTS